MYCWNRSLDEKHQNHSFLTLNLKEVASKGKREQLFKREIMNALYLATRATKDPCVFDTYWSTGLRTKGRVRVTVPLIEGARVAAELSSAQYLLVEKNVCGHDKTGAGLSIHTSCPEIFDLLTGTSPNSRLVQYCKFLRTRFVGTKFKLDTPPYRWADELCDTNVCMLEITKPPRTLIEVAGVGQAEITANAMERYISRFEKKPEKAWRQIINIAKEVKPAELVGSRSVFNGAKYRRPARYLVEEKRGIMFVIIEADRPGEPPRVATIAKQGYKLKVSENAMSSHKGCHQIVGC